MGEGGKLEGGISSFQKKVCGREGKGGEGVHFFGSLCRYFMSARGGDEKGNWDRENGAHAQPARIKRKKKCK